MSAYDMRVLYNRVVFANHVFTGYNPFGLITCHDRTSAWNSDPASLSYGLITA